MKYTTAEWFECKVRYNREDKGVFKKVSEIYTVDAMSFSEAEAHIVDELSKYVQGEYSVLDIKKAAYKDVYFDDANDASFWYRIKVGFIYVDDKSGKEKVDNVIYLMQAKDIIQASESMDNALKGLSIDYTILEVKETKIMDVIEHESSL